MATCLIALSRLPLAPDVGVARHPLENTLADIEKKAYCTTHKDALLAKGLFMETDSIEDVHGELITRGIVPGQCSFGDSTCQGKVEWLVRLGTAAPSITESDLTAEARALAHARGEALVPAEIVEERQPDLSGFVVAPDAVSATINGEPHPEPALSFEGVGGIESQTAEAG